MKKSIKKIIAVDEDGEIYEFIIKSGNSVSIQLQRGLSSRSGNNGIIERYPNGVETLMLLSAPESITGELVHQFSEQIDSLINF